jgi:MoaA/NifB/PqqE/SkfB family radical SAM enzyme
MNSLLENVEKFGLTKMANYLQSDPDKHMPIVINWLEKFDLKHIHTNSFQAFRNFLERKDNWYDLMHMVYSDIDPSIRKTFFVNFFVNGGVVGGQRQSELREKHKCNIPWAILMDPTSACNLRCKGCWAADYNHALNLSIETMDSIIKQGKEFGVYTYILSGGEPLVRKKDVIQLCKKHSDSTFMAFTNATLIDEEFAEEILQVKNFIPIVSIEGFEKETDMRRGEGTFNKIVTAMDIMRKKKILFGFSTCYHKYNTDVIGSEEYIDFTIEKGCKFGWFFTYIPVGMDAIPDLIATPEQREYMYRKIREYRKTKPLFTLDFWNDGDYSNGCIAGGRKYLHINANGDIEPCAFIHYADSNIKDKTLLEALKSPLFMEYHKGQPFNKNMYRPCPLLDNPEKLQEMVHRSNAKSTDMGNPEDVDHLVSKTINPAQKWAQKADKLWQQREVKNKKTRSKKTTPMQK